jgi:signal transduction histidine kinase
MLQTASGMSFSRAFSHMRAVTAVRLLEGNARHTLDLDVPDALPELFGDRRDPKQVLINLLGNAVKFTPEGGRIGVTVSMAGGSMEIVISDNGIGIPKDRIADLCQPFKRIENVLSSRHQGSGMGLFITKTLVGDLMFLSLSIIVSTGYAAPPLRADHRPAYFLGFFRDIEAI